MQLVAMIDAGLVIDKARVADPLRMTEHRADRSKLALVGAGDDQRTVRAGINPIGRDVRRDIAGAHRNLATDHIV